MRSDLIHLLTEFEIGVPNVSAAVDDKIVYGGCHEHFLTIEHV